MQTSSKQIAYVWLVGLLLAALRFFQFFLGKTLFFGDNFSLMVPGKLFTVAWLKQGILPLWNPLLFAGISWIGDINQSVVYPSTILFLLLSPATALNTTVIFHLALTFVGAYFLARRLIFSQKAAHLVAILWSCSLQIAVSIHNIATLQTLSFLPWIVWAGVSTRYNLRFSVLLGALIALQLFGGYPQYVLYAVAFSFVLSFVLQREVRRMPIKRFWKFVRGWMLAGVVAVGASAVVWMPFLPTLADSTRVIQSLDQAAAGSLQFGELIHMLLPAFFYSPIDGIRWGPLWNAEPNAVVYFGWFGLLLLGYSLRYFKRAPLFVRTLWIVIGVSLLFAFGEALPWFSFLNKVPLLSASRGASGILQLASLAGALVIGWSFDQLKFKNTLRWRALLRMAVFTAVLTSLVWLLVQIAFSQIWHAMDVVLSGRLSSSVFHTLERDLLLTANILRSVTIMSVLLALTLFFWQRKKLYLVLACVALDVALGSAGMFFFAPNQIYTTDAHANEIVSLMQNSDLAQYRVLTRNYNTPYTDFGAYWDALAVRQPFSDSYIDAQEIAEYNHLQRMRSGATPDWNLAFNVPIITGYTTLLPLDVQQRFAATISGEARINNLPEISWGDQQLADWSVGYYLRDTWFPLYDTTVPEFVLAETDNLILYQLPAKPRIRLLSGESADIDTFRETPNELSFAITTTRSGGLLVADRYDKDWRATVNSVEMPVENHNGMRRIQLDQGESNVRMWYEPRAFYYGIWISAVTMFLSAIGLLLRRPKKL